MYCCQKNKPHSSGDLLGQGRRRTRGKKEGHTSGFIGTPIWRTIVTSCTSIPRAVTSDEKSTPVLHALNSAIDLSRAFWDILLYKRLRSVVYDAMRSSESERRTYDWICKVFSPRLNCFPASNKTLVPLAVGKNTIILCLSPDFSFRTISS